MERLTSQTLVMTITGRQLLVGDWTYTAKFTEQRHRHILRLTTDSLIPRTPRLVVLVNARCESQPARVLFVRDAVFDKQQQLFGITYKAWGP